jgi:hypothetical protein
MAFFGRPSTLKTYVYCFFYVYSIGNTLERIQF